MSKNKQVKKGKWVDKGITIVLIIFAIGVAALILFIVGSKISEKKQEQAAESPAAATKAAEATETPPVDEADLVRYSCVISEEGKDTEGSEFLLAFNKKEGTYVQYLNAGDSSSELETGTFSKTKEYIKTTNNKGTENFLLYEGNYLVSKNALYEGTVPESKTFARTFTHEVDDVSKIEIKFRKDGTFSQKILRYSGSGEGEGKADTLEGTYRHKGRFIERKRENGDKLMPLYVYQDTLCASYYKKVKNS